MQTSLPRRPVSTPRLLEFYRTHYCSQLMRVAIVGRHSLEELEALATAAFSAVPCRGLEPTLFPAGATSTEGLLIKMVPEKEGHTIELQWRVEPELAHYKSAPSQYLSHLLG